VTSRWPERFNPRNPRLSVSAVFVAGMFMTIMDATVLAVTRPVPPGLGGYHLAFVVAAITMASGAVVASRVKDADAAATMAPPAPEPTPTARPS
jgi:hypothetical protein